MATLEGNSVGNRYKDLLQISNNNQGVNGILRPVSDGEGEVSALELSKTVVNVTGTFQIGGVESLVYSSTEKSKLSGIATGATANLADATLLSRSNHTGTQLASTVSDFAATVLSTMGSNGLEGLSTLEVNQLKNINTVTVTNANWQFVEGLDQFVTSTASPTFQELTVNAHNEKITGIFLAGPLIVTTETGIYDSPIAFTIKSARAISVVGTADITIKINGVALTGVALSVSPTSSSETYTANNIVSVGNNIEFDVTSVTGAEDVNVWLEIERVL